MYYSTLTVIDAHSRCDRMPRVLSAANILRPSSFACSISSRTLASSLSLPLRLRTAVSSCHLLCVLTLAAAFWRVVVHAACSTIPSFLTSSTNCLTSGSPVKCSYFLNGHLLKNSFELSPARPRGNSSWQLLEHWVCKCCLNLQVIFK